MTESLHVRRLEVHRAPGVLRGFELSGLSTGINVIHGPNGCGKTTTALALEALLWPRSAGARSWMSASVEIGGSRWRLEVDGGSAAYQCEGRDSDAPLLPGGEARDRYRLSLHELLAADNADFAAAILRESAGGYDLTAAAPALRPRAAVPVRLPP
jgi:energy-coupling factor transporter ATP-binding protein EcfA2